MIRSIAAAALALATLGAPAAQSTVRAPVLGPAPEPVRVLRGFDPPADPFGPGHLGVDLAAGRHAVISAAGSGVVRFAGPVAGRGVVVIEHPDGIRTEYEPVQPQVEVGAAVRAGDPIGQLAGQHAGCAPRSCLHWGARRGDAYLDPMSLLGRLGPVRLLPWTPEPRDS